MKELNMINSAMPTSKCPMCGGKTACKQDLLGKHPKQYGFHAHCPQCHASFSNAKDPKKRVVVWDMVESNTYPQDKNTIARLRTIIAQSMNKTNRKKKEPDMCNENSEDALTWSVFNTLEKSFLLERVFASLSVASDQPAQGDTRIYYWGYNDKYPDDKVIQEYVGVLNLAGEPTWPGGYSEPDILLFSPKHGLINIEVKYMSPNDDKLREHSNQKRNDRAQKMLDIGKKYVKTTQVKDWIWYELLRMWVPGCLVAEHMNMQSFTLVNLLPKSLLEKEKGQVFTDMKKCIKQNEHFQFKQVAWEDFMQTVQDYQVINDQAFWGYIQRKF
jgi:hypothetical protein